MQARIIREDIEISPSAVLSDDERAQTVTRDTWRNGMMEPVQFWQLGAVVSRPDSYMLVRMGVAESHDEECLQRAAMTPEQARQAQHAARRVTAGISPEDFPLYDAGIITGYNPDGSFVPGPNWDQMPQDQDDEDDE
jgi:hypothetical protein